VLAELTVKGKNEDGNWEPETLYCTPVFTNNTFFLMSRDKLMTIGKKD
jgi:hypothetical protein